MATSPAYASASVLVGAVLLNTTETNTLVPTAASVVVTAGTNGSKIEELVVQAGKTATLVATTVAGLVYIWLFDGTTYRPYIDIAVTAVTASTTASGYRSSTSFNNLFLPSGWSIYASQSIAGNASLLTVSAFGGSY